MSKVYTGASMSLDGYIAGLGESGFEHLFKWYANGDVAVPTANPAMTLQMTPQSADHFRTIGETIGAIVVGRKLFDSTGGWGGNHPMGLPVVVLSHSVPDGWPRDDAPFSFVTEGIERAIEVARERAGDKVVGVTAARSPGSASRPGCSTRSGSTSSRSCSAAARRSSTSSRPLRASWRVRSRSSTAPT
jgi:dihydrofolate reductase